MIPPLPPTLAGTFIKIANYLIDMKKRDLLLIGFVGLFLLSFGFLTGYVPSPLLIAMAQHETLLKSAEERKTIDEQIIDILRLQLYLSRENCMHTAKTESEKSRCDRDSIRNAIIEDALPTSTASPRPR